MSRVRGHPSPGIDPHEVQEHTMSPHKREALGHFAQFIAVCSSAKMGEIGENLLSVSDPISGYRRGSAMPVLSYVHQLFNVDQCQAYIHTLRWKDRPLQCPRCQSHDVILGGHTTTDPAANAIGATAASAPSTTSPIPCCTRASGRCRTGSWRRFCFASPAHRDALPER